MRVVVGSFTGLFSHAIIIFFKTENKYFLTLTKEFIEAFVFIIFLVFMYFNTGGIALSMTHAGIAYVFASGICAIWMFIVILRIPVLDVIYRGICKF